MRAVFIFFVGVLRVISCFIVVFTTIASIVGAAEIVFRNLAFSYKDTDTIGSDGVCVALDSVEIIAVCVINKSCVRKTFGKEQVTLLRTVIRTIFVL